MSNPTALVLGGTSGVGLAVARRLEAGGATVHIAGRGERRLDDIAASDSALIGHQLDATDRQAVGALAESIGRIDYLVVAFSGADGVGPIADLELVALRRAFDAKFWGYLVSIQAALPHLAP